ncbi:s-adenosyl-l-methionine-dependent methyltransferase [Fusarium acutatum]|uniref:S-adenosyl-l-methionine-dependent methyltransferase n=1 Tax=Fusarium acutatum TaxID=78861 RepID=A0A8H4NBL6_9HYPO|nr:s-adenosyl-l-methionine-dependent methyltransferase [Fusarium acutatum]
MGENDEQRQKSPSEADLAPIEYDPQVVGSMGDDNSTISSGSLRDSTASITSSILEYRHINGRPFQQSQTTEYWAPTDDDYQEGQDILHHYTLLLFDDKLHLAPIGKNPQKVLDVGTGTGIWAIDMADEYPSAEVVGTDISAVQPAFVPPNCSFQIDDAQLDWTFKPDEFDFIHIRYLYGAIDDWKKLYRQAFTHVRPGGWVESLEIDIETHSENPKIEKDEGHIFKTWCKLFFECGRKTGRTWEIARDGRQEEYMREAGFTDLVSKSWKLPVGGWPQDKKLKQIGLYNEAFIDHSIDAFAIFPIGEILGWSKEEVTVLVSQMRKALKEPRALPYFNVRMVYGRKPERTPKAA